MILAVGKMGISKMDFSVGPICSGASAAARSAASGLTLQLILLIPFSDCYLRQGDGGTKTARFGSKTVF